MSSYSALTLASALALPLAWTHLSLNLWPLNRLYDFKFVSVSACANKALSVDLSVAAIASLMAGHSETGSGLHGSEAQSPASHASDLANVELGGG
eukprot:CAMPEP_0171567918 /NCGR_PEP_ID=MMETSP0961-20121227/1444_1 /TAXON_ID=87120 /ORGANISM="Aurantiochytrium limacinum, Strain ATCCMYA-1381" /LENGTH=94 /DNA_ID=CAMNT_0012121927 /DNA_START=577 /DNA_END=857 /DNA_ORIENTATION=-